tara:strand:+ start:510 stop:815 length:306 start_codon:yes stop_codon:yes gene_type:complete
MKSRRRNPPPPAKQNRSVVNYHKPSIGSIIMDGMTFGAGSSLGHRAMDSIFGPRKIEVSQPKTNNDICSNLIESYTKCSLENTNNCSEIYELLNKLNCNSI